MMTVANAQLFVNGKIFTSKKGDDGLYESMLVQNGKVLYVGAEKGAIQVTQQVSRVTGCLGLGGICR
jgi:predicted amidohydrolase YtcJ